MKAQLYNIKNEVVGEVDVPTSLFGAPWKPALVSQVIRAQEANARKLVAHAKGRGEVRGGGRKPWRQKGTGRARHGSTRSPIWIGGGKAHGPVKERDYSEKINKKMRRAALASVLSKKFKEEEVKIFDRLVLDQPKTRLAWSLLTSLVPSMKKRKKADVLMVPGPEGKYLFRAVRNLVKAKAVTPTTLSVRDLALYQHIFIDQHSLPILEKHFTTHR